MEVERSTKKLPVMEVFGPTIQGEGAVIGMQTYFVRMGLCDYKCVKCDSMHAVDGELVSKNANWMTQEELVGKFLDFRASKGPHTTTWVTLSGGNPCIHDLTEFVQAMNDLSIDIAVETQGTFCPDWLKGCSHITISPKGPGMGETTDFEVLDNFINKLWIWDPSSYSIKVVVFDQRDLEFASMVYERYVTVKKQVRDSQFFLSLGNPYPPIPGDTEQAKGGSGLPWMLVKRYDELLPDIMSMPNLCNVKFLPQWHVIVWGNKQGV